ncbi:FMN-binding negative transcriptional regulator [Muricoccus aerilatus]|uniref:FMN-binding negative transcriptional regulator n=1 Tax=Muricoccus aerilatus TaxID=452982 RepID=UPI000694F1CF|nr:FMN-binding negative transcriptional regulator [Roseomonas aerilata]
MSDGCHRSPAATAPALYIPPAFREEDPAVLRGLIAASRLAILTSNGPEGVPLVTPLPLVLDGDHLLGHLARANPHWQALAAAPRALAVFMGAEAYVSPGFYPSKAEHGRVVPTWNYEAVTVEGAVEVFEDPARLLDAVSRLTGRHEEGRAEPWAVTDAPAAFTAAQLKGIVGIRLLIERVLGKRKLSQNRSAPDREGVREGLAASADPRDRAAAEAMDRG